MFIYHEDGYMLKMKAIKAFRDVLSFLTIIPLAKNEEFIVSSADYMFLFPAAGALIGLLAAVYFEVCALLLPPLFAFAKSIVTFLPETFLAKTCISAMTLSFLLVLTGLQHFDGLVDLGNAIGLGKKEDKQAIAHAWTVTHKGAVLALAVELVAFLGLAFSNLSRMFGTIIVAEVSAKLAMVTTAWTGKPAYKGLGSFFVEKVRKRKRHVIAYAFTATVAYLILGVNGLWMVIVGFLSGIAMERLSTKVFGGVTGDGIGAANEVARAFALAFGALVIR
jgi:adenosylcobinamide-GDP ribazoletransferase